jgi:hypothetical protein
MMSEIDRDFDEIDSLLRDVDEFKLNNNFQILLSELPQSC